MDVTEKHYIIHCRSYREGPISDHKYYARPRSIKRSAIVGNILDSNDSLREALKTKSLKNFINRGKRRFGK